MTLKHSFNPYFYWSYYLTEKIKNILDLIMVYCFNPYFYWSYYLTINIPLYHENYFNTRFQSLFLLVLLFNSTNTKE